MIYCAKFDPGTFPYELLEATAWKNVREGVETEAFHISMGTPKRRQSGIDSKVNFDF